MSYIRQPDLPRILMLDCTDELIASVTANGYNVEVGYTGFFEEHPEPVLPANLHERDLIIVDLEPSGWTQRDDELLFPFPKPGAESAEANDVRHPESKRTLKRFVPSFSWGAVIVCLLESNRSFGVRLLAGAGTFSWLADSKVGTVRTSTDSDLRLASRPPSLKLPAWNALARLFQANKDGMKSIRNLHGAEPLLLNDASEVKAGWEYVPSGGILFLPHFDRPTTAVRGLLREVLPQITPTLFPQRSRTDWHSDDLYQMPAVLDIRRRRRQVEQKHQQSLEQLDAQEATAKLDQERFLALLTAGSHELREVVCGALEWLEFERVVDEDERRTAAGIKDKEEDLRLQDPGYFAVVEVTSGKGQAPESDYQDLLK